MYSHISPRRGARVSTDATSFFNSCRGIEGMCYGFLESGTCTLGDECPYSHDLGNLSVFVPPAEDLVHTRATV